MLLGRDAERDRIERLLADAKAGQGGALVVAGEAGIGKTTLIQDAVGGSTGMRVLHAVGFESEAELPFAALHLLLYPFLDRLPQLPAPQAEALRGAFGLADTGDANPFLIGAGTLTLLAELAAESPVACIVDDVQWLDRGSSEALLFAARRFRADPIAMVFGVRETAVPFPTPGIEWLRLPALPRDAAGGLLDGALPGLALPVRERVLDEAQGNPLALLELGAARLSAQRAGTTEQVHEVGPLPATRRVQDAFRAQISALPADTGLVLLAASADGTAPLDTVLRVARALGADGTALDAAEAAGLVTAEAGRIAFRHPLVRSAAYQRATHHQRIAAHRAFAAELAAAGDADRRAWHLAVATAEPDEDVASELERTARRAEKRGGAMAVSAAYEHAARLSPDADPRARRMAKAAHAAYDAGRPDRAARLAAEVITLTADPGTVAAAMHLRAQVEYERTSPAADAALALDAARVVLDTDPEGAVSILTEVVGAGRDGAAADLVAEGVRLLRDLKLPSGSPLTLPADAQIGWGELLAGRPAEAAAPMRALIRAATAEPVDYLHRIVAGFSALMLADDDAALAVMETMLDEARAAGALLWIPYSLELVALGRALRGDAVDAQAGVEEGVALGTELGMDTEVAVLRTVGVWTAALLGDEDRCRALAAEAIPVAAQRHPVGAAIASWGLGLLDLAAGRYAEAVDTLHAVCTGPVAHDMLVRAVPDLLEAAVRNDTADRAAGPLVRLHTWAEHAGSPLASALSLRCRALSETDADTADEYFRAAAEQHTRHGGRYEQARTRLLHGEWLRRRRRRTEARAELDAALTAFEHVGAARWAARAAAELAALGEPAHRRQASDDPLARLTPQEYQVVKLAATGMSNKDIGAGLFLSPRTVGHHLYRAYPKLGVSRRAELARFVAAHELPNG
ncbi:helix-turn-helix transcriptional regulator [Yinghuangia soli]|uniref:AAA family ATPase n=1 Tax=Yinghuangia soli TaxID=2908204 RepID=A0AA41Q2G0_9ACTN|nr:LuxR family transcriptional regulator [Yinghuangia soli]MCF2530329.1 AAA family ATPase [Yinghuangia soli]